MRKNTGPLSPEGAGRVVHVSALAAHLGGIHPVDARLDVAQRGAAGLFGGVGGWGVGWERRRVTGGEGGGPAGRREGIVLRWAAVCCWSLSPCAADSSPTAGNRTGKKGGLSLVFAVGPHSAACCVWQLWQRIAPPPQRRIKHGWKVTCNGASLCQRRRPKPAPPQRGGKPTIATEK